MRIRPEAQAILDRAVPNRLDSLWCEILASSYGAGLLEAWDLSLEQVRASAPVIECDGAEVLRWAEMHSYINAPICTAEWVAEDLLVGRGAWQGPPLEHFTGRDVEYHEVDIRDVYALAFEEGLEEALERHYLQAARAVWPMLDRILEFTPRPLASFDRKYQGSFRNGPVDADQLAQACLRHPALLDWMKSFGVANWRLRNNLLESELRLRITGERLRWMKPACEEARLLGSTVVGADHLLLALMGELHGVTRRVLREQGVDERSLRRRLTGCKGASGAVRDMVFEPALLSIFQEACGADGKDPYSGVLLRSLLQQKEFPEIPAVRVLPALDRMLAGSLPDSLDLLTMDGLRLSMTEEQVLERLGVPMFRKEECWMYPSTSVMFHQGRVHGVVGKRLEALGESVERGSHWLHAERMLGALRLWHGRPGPAWAMISRGEVTMLTLSLEQDSAPE